MRTVLIVLFMCIVGGTVYGFYIRPNDYSLGELCIGASIATLFFVWMPIFIYHRWRNRSFKDYMLTKENLDKMREKGNEEDI